MYEQEIVKYRIVYARYVNHDKIESNLIHEYATLDQAILNLDSIQDYYSDLGWNTVRRSSYVMYASNPKHSNLEFCIQELIWNNIIG